MPTEGPTEFLVNTESDPVDERCHQPIRRRPPRIDAPESLVSVFMRTSVVFANATYSKYALAFATASNCLPARSFV